MKSHPFTTAAIALVSAGILVGLIVQYRTAHAPAPTPDTTATLAADIAGCGKGVGRWGGRLITLRDRTGTVLSQTTTLDNPPDVDESEAVLRAFFDCMRTVGLSPGEVYVDFPDGRRVYTTATGMGIKYHVKGGRIICVSWKDSRGELQARCKPGAL